MGVPRANAVHGLQAAAKAFRGFNPACICGGRSLREQAAHEKKQEAVDFDEVGRHGFDGLAFDGLVRPVSRLPSAALL